MKAGPAWSPNSTALAFASQNRREGLSKARIAALNLANGQVLYLTGTSDNRTLV